MIGFSFGWKHLHGIPLKYSQMKEPVGGIKTVQMDKNKNYSLDDVKKIAADAMKSDVNKYYWEDSEINIGNYNNEIYTEFTDDKGNKCDFWKFSEKVKTKNRHLKLYLYTKKLEISELGEQVNESTKLQNASKSDQDLLMKPTEKENDIPSNYAFSSIVSSSATKDKQSVSINLDNFPNCPSLTIKPKLDLPVIKVKNKESKSDVIVKKM